MTSRYSVRKIKRRIILLTNLIINANRNSDEYVNSWTVRYKFIYVDLYEYLTDR